MIIEALVSLVVGLVGLVLSAIPSFEVPSWATDASDSLGSVMDKLSGLGVWVPLSLAWTVAGAVLACWGIGFVIKGVRIVASFFTAGGGSAA